VSSAHWPQPTADERYMTADAEQRRPEATPPEAPGAFVVQPLEYWSTSNLVPGLMRLVRGTGPASVRV
jgi:hypothetical protein